MSLDLDCTSLGSKTTPIAVAVSGGADSFALLHFLIEGGWPVTALTVDHGLRPNSNTEARAVAQWCQARAIPHQTLAWQGVKPSTGIQAAARSARYGLLVAACNSLGIDHLVTGHTMDDQAETIFMRMARGSGEGLAGMALKRGIAAGIGAPISLLRPALKTMRRADMRRYCVTHNLPFTDDPSNDNPKYERVRVRALLAALEQQGDLLRVQALCRSAQRIADMCQSERDYIAQNAKQAGLKFHSFGGAVLTNPPAIPPQAQVLLLTKIAQSLGAGISLPRDAFTGLRDDQRPIAVGGIAVQWHKGEILLMAEPSTVIGRKDGTKGLRREQVRDEAICWDNRLILTPPPQFAADSQWTSLGQVLPVEIVTSTAKRRALAAIPCVCLGNTITHVPKDAIKAIEFAFGGWKEGEDTLFSLGTFDAYSIAPERFYDNIIRY